MTLITSVPVLRISDYARARAFWRDVLGFDLVEEAGDPVTGFGILRRDRAQVFLTSWDGPEAEYTGWRAYFHTDALDQIATDLRAAGQGFRGPARTEYGMDEVEVTDPDGNVVCFGQDVP
ncbi:MAG: glyoxalase superfamily protein [Pseudomonadota bacterium]